MDSALTKKEVITLLLGFMQAYKNSLRKTGASEQTLPGLSYNPDQLFFIASAQVLAERDQLIVCTATALNTDRSCVKLQLLKRKVSSSMLMSTAQVQ